MLKQILQAQKTLRDTMDSMRMDDLHVEWAHRRKEHRRCKRA